MYVSSLMEFGTTYELSACGGWLLVRSIPGYDFKDATGCYPFFVCSNWSRLAEDLEVVPNGLVSICVVTDPFGDYDEALLRTSFPDLVVPFKEHYIVDLGEAPRTFISAHHQRYAKKALKNCDIEILANPVDFLDDWTRLYDILKLRHDIRGIAQFSRTAFTKQLQVPGIVVFRAVCNGETIGMALWYRQDSVAYYHLGAYSKEGYDLRSSFGLFWVAIDWFRRAGLRWLDLGSAPGRQMDAGHGLSRFKRGWSTGTRIAYLCGKIIDRNVYEELAAASNCAESSFFPAYRSLSRT
jgi:hypothetical protein